MTAKDMREESSYEQNEKTYGGAACLPDGVPACRYRMQAGTG
jgi:hypothetical protein